MKTTIACALLAASVMGMAAVLVNYTISTPDDVDAKMPGKQQHYAPPAVHRAAHQETPPIAAHSSVAPRSLAPLESAVSPPSAATAAERASLGEPARQDGAQGSAPSPLTDAELVQRARQVEYEADRQVLRLDDTVGLTADQFAQAFRIYARASSSYDPRIPIEGQTGAASAPAAAIQSAADASSANQPATAAASGNPAQGAADAANQVVAAVPSSSKTADAQVVDTLNADQQVAFGKAWLDRDLWWTEIVSQLASDFPEPTATDTTQGETVAPSDHQGDNIFDILNSAP
jgi:hypothetical protein